MNSQKFSVEKIMMRT